MSDTQVPKDDPRLTSLTKKINALKGIITGPNYELNCGFKEGLKLCDKCFVMSSKQETCILCREKFTTCVSCETEEQIIAHRVG